MWDGLHHVTFPSGKLFLDQFLSLFLLNSQEFFRYKIAKSQGFRYSSFKVKSHSDSIRVWFGLLESFWSFQTWYSSRFSADAHRHQVYFGLSFKQVGLWFIHPLSFGSSPPLSRLIRLYSSPSTSLPLCAPNSFGESLLLFYILWSVLIICYADPLKNRHEIQVSSTSGGSFLMRR